MDDGRGLPVYIRLCAHGVAAGLAIGLVGSIATLPLGHSAISLGYATWPITLVSLVWFLNLFNFMDGIDGIAVSEAVFMSAAGGALAVLNRARRSVCGFRTAELAAGQNVHGRCGQWIFGLCHRRVCAGHNRLRYAVGLDMDTAFGHVSYRRHSHAAASAFAR